ncbi:MAG TPA: patatin-like phospholipase family protein [Phaeodactylibacter sp.]|nr:patatin-like phospholipase family protein [Phaeodactylibacter sp.]
MKQWIENIYYSFPVQLVVLHLRNSPILIGSWLVLVLLMTGTIADVFGIHYLFLSPEYLGRVDLISYYFLGLAFGAFYITWNLTTYMLSAHHFPFLACLSRPFTKFCLNNSVIPLFFLGLYFYYAIHFQWYFEYWAPEIILYNMLGFVLGIITMLLLSSIYFQFTNKDVFNLLKKQNQRNLKGVEKIMTRKRANELQRFRSKDNRWRIETYLTESLKPRLVRSVDHYDDCLLFSVFKQNHLNALIIQLVGLVVLLALGYMIDNPWFRLPAGASIFIFASVLVAITGGIIYWFRHWSLSIFILLLILINFMTSYDIFNHKNKAYGLDYTVAPVPYHRSALEAICPIDTIQKDMNNTIAILNKWRRQFKKKPKMVIFCVSGGGMKASVWAMQILQEADSLMQGKLLQHTSLITGASGGMIGMAYMRELLLKKHLGERVDLYSKTHIDKISKDLLNSIAFTIVTNDLFMPISKFELDGYKYLKDRGYIFEKQLNENTDYLLQRKLKDYRSYEAKAVIPMMMITPSIVNDGRRLIISPQGISYMMKAPIGIRQPNAVEIDAVDFGRIFKNQNAYNLQFTSALRMNATYPYILPNVYLPSHPNIEVMDAGFRDNFGLLTATRFLHIFKDWILENTAGVVLIQVRGSDKRDQISSTEGEGMVEALFNPLGIAGQILELQDYEHGNNLGFLYDLFGEGMFDVIRFTYEPSQLNQRASMTFHLTTREKNDILNAYYLPKNQRSLIRLLELIGGGYAEK